MKTNATKLTIGVLAIAVVMFTVHLSHYGGASQFVSAESMRQSSPDGTKNDQEPELERAQEDVKWKDYDSKDLTHEQRVRLRPGNLEVIAAVGRFVEGWYAINPHRPDMAFPHWEEGTKYDSQSQYDADKRERYIEQDGQRINRLRSYNFEVRNVQFINIEAGSDVIPNYLKYGFSESEHARFKEVRRAHPERCTLVLLVADLESLQSDKVESSDPDDPFKLFFVKKADGWKLVYIED